MLGACLQAGACLRAAGGRNGISSGRYSAVARPFELYDNAAMLPPVARCKFMLMCVIACSEFKSLNKTPVNCRSATSYVLPYGQFCTHSDRNRPMFRYDTLTGLSYRKAKSLLS